MKNVRLLLAALMFAAAYTLPAQAADETSEYCKVTQCNSSGDCVTCFWTGATCEYETCDGCTVSMGCNGVS